MADDLRTRIAVVLYRRRGGPSWDDETEELREMYRCDADAVIREVLTPELPGRPTMSDNLLDEKLVRVWDRDYNLRGQQFVPWNAGTFTIPADDPLAIELWDGRELGHQITVESTDEMAWWIDRMDRTKDGTLIVTCRPHVDMLRDLTVPDWKLVEVWLSAEKRWKSKQLQADLRTRIACVLAGITLNNTPKPEYLEMADAVIHELGLHEEVEQRGAFIRKREATGLITVRRYVTEWQSNE